MRFWNPWQCNTGFLIGFLYPWSSHRPRHSLPPQGPLSPRWSRWWWGTGQGWSCQRCERSRWGWGQRWCDSGNPVPPDLIPCGPGFQRASPWIQWFPCDWLDTCWPVSGGGGWTWVPDSCRNLLEHTDTSWMPVGILLGTWKNVAWNSWNEGSQERIFNHTYLYKLTTVNPTTIPSETAQPFTTSPLPNTHTQTCSNTHTHTDIQNMWTCFHTHTNTLYPCRVIYFSEPEVKNFISSAVQMWGHLLVNERTDTFRLALAVILMCNLRPRSPWWACTSHCNLWSEQPIITYQNYRHTRPRVNQRCNRVL